MRAAGGPASACRPTRSRTSGSTPSTDVKTEVVSQPARRDFALPRGRGFWIALGTVVAAIGLVIGFAIGNLGDDSSSSTPPQPSGAVAPVQEAPDFATRARNLADWLRENSR